MQISLPLSEHRPLRERWFPNGEWALALVLLFEIAVFSAIGENFFSAENFFEVDPPQRGIGIALARDDAHCHHRRHRSFRGLHDGARRHRLWRSVA